MLIWYTEIWTTHSTKSKFPASGLHLSLHGEVIYLSLMHKSSWLIKGLGKGYDFRWMGEVAVARRCGWSMSELDFEDQVKGIRGLWFTFSDA